MFKRIAVTLASLALLLGTSEPAQAAADITRGGSCKHSEGWTTLVSVNFNNTSGSPSTGDIDYITLNSPGPLIPGQTILAFYDANLTETGATSYGWVRDLDKLPRYVYRADPSGVATRNIRRVEIDPRTNTGVWCSLYQGIPARVTSAN